MKNHVKEFQDVCKQAESLINMNMNNVFNSFKDQIPPMAVQMMATGVQIPMQNVFQYANMVLSPLMEISRHGEVLFRIESNGVMTWYDNGEKRVIENENDLVHAFNYTLSKYHNQGVDMILKDINTEFIQNTSVDDFKKLKEQYGHKSN